MHLAGLLDALALSGGTHTIDDVLAQIESGEAQLWWDDDGTVVTEIYDYPGKKVLHFWLAAGELNGVIRQSHRAMEWGREQGCTTANLVGRRGWERALAAEGWGARLTLMTKEL
jgi:hypothetical protein